LLGEVDVFGGYLFVVVVDGDDLIVVE